MKLFIMALLALCLTFTVACAQPNLDRTVTAYNLLEQEFWLYSISNTPNGNKPPVVLDTPIHVYIGWNYDIPAYIVQTYPHMFISEKDYYRTQ